MSAFASPALQYPWADAPAPGQAVEVAPGVLWMRMVLPTALNHINVWAIADGDGWTVVDTGMHTPGTVDAWNQLLSEQGPLQGRAVTRVIATHMHPDHVGMAGALVRRFNTRLWMTRLEYLHCRVLVSDTGRPVPPDGVQFYQRAGWNAAQLAAYHEKFGTFGRFIDQLPDSYRRIEDGETLRIGAHSWHVLVGQGHSPEHACLYCPALNVLISGDQVLPRISSNVSVHPTEPDADPLSEWLSSIEKIRHAVPHHVLVLPAHNLPFKGLHERLDALAQSVHTGLAQLLVALQEPRRTIDVFGSLFGRPINDPSLFFMATGESQAHLNHLIQQGRVVVDHLDAHHAAWYRAV